MPIGGNPGGSFGSTIFNADVDPNAEIDPTKLAYSSMGWRSRKTTSQSIPHNTVTAVSFGDADSVDAVPSGYSEIHSTSSNPARIQLRQKGFWLIVASIVFEGAAGTGTVRYGLLAFNGVTAFASTSEYIALASSPHGINIMGIAYTSLNTDYVEIQVYHTQGIAINIGDFGVGSYAAAVFLGDIT